ncbi:hypothetical protein ACHAXR_001141, partial [Thalassiosira sp. AJA248-18]
MFSFQKNVPKLDSTAPNWKREGRNTPNCWNKTKRQPIATTISLY